MLARMEMMAITTNSSIKVNARPAQERVGKGAGDELFITIWEEMGDCWKPNQEVVHRFSLTAKLPIFVGKVEHLDLLN
jgi:hypothetical protein